MKPAAASPVLHQARALGRAFLGAGRALRRGMTWFLLIAFGVCLPWLVFLGSMQFGSPDSPDALGRLGSVWSVTPYIAAEVALVVVLLSLLVPVLEGRREVSLRGLRSPATRLVVAAAALAGAEMAWTSILILGWEDPLAGLLGGRYRMPTFDIACALARAWAAAFVISAMRDAGGWPWRARHLVVSAAVLMLGAMAMWLVVEPMSDWPGFFERILNSDWDQIPPIWWVVWRIGEALIALVALEYLRIEPPPAPAPAEAAP